MLENQFDNITFQNMFWLFIVGSVLGVILEGFWCLVRSGQWESHVVTIWGPFCIIYGLGAVAFFIVDAYLKNQNIVLRFFIFALVANMIEYIGGWVLEHGLHMRAWDYSKHFLNINGYISLKMTLIWGILGIAFSYTAVPFINQIFHKMQGEFWNVSCILLTVFMVVNFIVTAMCFIRWKNRHEGKQPSNYIERIIDQRYDNNKMEKRFCEWHFINESS